jgi:hypothetical protein
VLNKVKTASGFMLVCFFTVCLCTPAFALMVDLSTEKLTRDSELIVTGYVEDIASQWTPDNKSITTTAVISVQKIIKGLPARKKIQVILLGGQVGDIVMRVSDEAPLHKGERVLLFLSPEKQFSGGGACRIVGRAQGKYTIGDDLIARKRGFSVEADAEHMDNTMPLETLIEKIRGYVDEQ